MFSDAEVTLIRESFAPTVPVGAKAADKMYANLFEASPDIAILFSEFTGPPKSMMWATLGLIVDNLEDIKSLDLPLQQLGARHVRFGAKHEFYGVFADVIIGTVAEISGDAWTLDHENAWESMLGYVVQQMLSGAIDAKADAA